MAKELGCFDVYAMLGGPATEPRRMLTEWIAFGQIEPYGAEHQERLAKLSGAIGARQPFVPLLHRPPTIEPPKRQGPTDMRENLRLGRK